MLFSYSFSKIKRLGSDLIIDYTEKQKAEIKKLEGETSELKNLSSSKKT